MDRVTLIYKVLAGDANLPEQRTLARWLHESEENRREYENIRLLWRSTMLVEDRHPQEGAFDAIRHRVRKDQRRRRRMRAIISVLLAMIFGLLLVFLFQTWFVN